jgi:uncharacterized YigZ family protein
VVKGSRFLARALRAETETDAGATLQGIRRRHHDATHHCWALRLGSGTGLFERWDDDGEPSGTAGVPIAGAIRKAALRDLVVVVTRYFGGTKLGTGGLVRAYADAARAALVAAPRRAVWSTTQLEAAFVYDDLGVVESILTCMAPAVLVVRREFSPDPCFTVALKASRAEEITHALTEATAGRVRLRRLGATLGTSRG